MKIRLSSICRILLLSGFMLFAFVQCKKDKKTIVEEEINFDEIEETPVSGKIEILVEESIFPVVEDVRDVFESEYRRAKIDLIKKSEQEILMAIFKDSARLAVLPRALDENEKELIKGRLFPKVTHFATDAIVFVASKSYSDSIVDYDSLLKNLKQEKPNEEDQAIFVFDNVNSSVSKQFRKMSGVESFPKNYAYFLPSTEEVIDYVSKNPKAIGIVGLNWLVQPDEKISEKLKTIKVLGVKNPEDGKYYKATQNNIAEKTYPLTRDLYIWDFQGKTGLGVGFSSYIAGYKGQRIILKSGLVPFKVPPREILVKKEL